MRAVEAATGHARAERELIHILWLSTGLGCDGESVAMTAALNPTIEELLRGAVPGAPRVVLYNAMLAFETGDEFVVPFRRAAERRLGTYVLVLEGSVPNEEISGEGHWSGLGVDPVSAQPVDACQWIDRLAPGAAAVVAMGTCAAFGGIPAMQGNPTGAMGLADYLGPGWRSRRDIPLVNLPGCPVQPDNITQTLLQLLLHIAGAAPVLELDELGRPAWLFNRTVQEGCGRAGFAEQAEFAATPADTRGCLVKIGCKGPVVKCNVPVRGWMGRVGGCPNVGGICIGCTMPGFPDRFTPFMAPNPLGSLAAAGARFTYGPVMRRMRRQAARRVAA